MNVTYYALVVNIPYVVITSHTEHISLDPEASHKKLQQYNTCHTNQLS